MRALNSFPLARGVHLFFDFCLDYLLSTAIAAVIIKAAAINELLILIEARVVFFASLYVELSSSNSLNSDRRTESNFFAMTPS